MISVVNIVDLYGATFGNRPYFLNQKDSETPAVDTAIYSGIPQSDRLKSSIDYTTRQIALNKKNAYGMDIWFPITLKSGNLEIEIEACTVGVNMTSTIISTPVSERKGEVNEVFHEDSVKFNIKGFIIGKNRFFPEEQINILRALKTTTNPLELHGGYPEIFLEESCRVIMPQLDFPEVQGKAPWIRPFTMTLREDYIQDLIIP